MSPESEPSSTPWKRATLYFAGGILVGCVATWAWNQGSQPARAESKTTDPTSPDALKQLEREHRKAHEKRNADLEAIQEKLKTAEDR